MPSSPSGISFLQQNFFLFPAPLHLWVVLLSPGSLTPCLSSTGGWGGICTWSFPAATSPGWVWTLNSLPSSGAMEGLEHAVLNGQFGRSFGLICTAESSGELWFIFQWGHIYNFKLCFPRVCTPSCVSGVWVFVCLRFFLWLVRVFLAPPNHFVPVSLTSFLESYFISLKGLIFPLTSQIADAF